MTSENIIKELKRKGFNYSMVAEATGVTPSHVRNVALRIFTSRRVAEAIAIAMDRPFEEAFPEYEDKTADAKGAQRKKTVESLKKKIAKAN